MAVVLPISDDITTRKFEGARMAILEVVVASKRSIEEFCGGMVDDMANRRHREAGLLSQIFPRFSLISPFCFHVHASLSFHLTACE